MLSQADQSSKQDQLTTRVLILTLCESFVISVPRWLKSDSQKLNHKETEDTKFTQRKSSQGTTHVTLSAWQMSKVLREFL